MTVAFCLVWWKMLVFWFSCTIFFFFCCYLRALTVAGAYVYTDWFNICLLSVVNKHSCITPAVMNPVIKTEKRVIST